MSIWSISTEAGISGWRQCHGTLSWVQRTRWCRCGSYQIRFSFAARIQIPHRVEVRHRTDARAPLLLRSRPTRFVFPNWWDRKKVERTNPRWSCSSTWKRGKPRSMVLLAGLVMVMLLLLADERGHRPLRLVTLYPSEPSATRTLTAPAHGSRSTSVTIGSSRETNGSFSLFHRFFVLPSFLRFHWPPQVLAVEQ